MTDRDATGTWRSVEDLTRIGFARSSVVMVNEAHSGPLRCPRTRQVGLQVLDAAHETGVHRFAMEALQDAFAAEANESRNVPAVTAGYLAQPEMRALIQRALDLEWTLLPYEADVFALQSCGFDRNDIRRVNRREAEQADNLARLSSHGEPMLVWCGNGHLTRVAVQDWRPMGYVLREVHGIEPFAIDQTQTVKWPDRGPSFRVDGFQHELTVRGGVAGFLSEEAPADLSPGGADAYLLALNNEMT